MGSFEDSNCHSLTDSFSLYERYLRSFNVVDSFVEERHDPVQCEYENEAFCEGNSNIDLSVNKHCEIAADERQLMNAAAVNLDKQIPIGLDPELCLKADDSNVCGSPAPSTENSSATAEHSLLTEKSDNTVPVSSEDSKSDRFKHPIFISSTMENSNNAVDSVPLFRDIRPTESVFKLPIRELSFNGTLKHVQKLKPIVDPITALTSSAELLEEKSSDHYIDASNYHIEINDQKQCSSNAALDSDQKNSSRDTSNSYDENRIEKSSESTGDSQYEGFNKNQPEPDEGSSKWNDQSYSSLEASSFDSGVRSPDIFDDDDADPKAGTEPFWNFLKDFEMYDRKRVRRLEENLQGILPPPSVTILKTDVTEMLKKYYAFLPAFSEEKDPAELNAMTPPKRVSLVQLPVEASESLQGPVEVLKDSTIEDQRRNSISKECTNSEIDTSLNKSIDIKMCSEIEAKETPWPDVLKCRYYDVYYNRSHYSAKFELLALRYGERYVGAETETSVNVYSGGQQSPSSATKRKAIRLKMSQAKSPGRRLSHLARRRQAFCSAATINEKAQASSAKMVLIDRNYFPHRKLIHSSERKSPRTKRTPGKKTPKRKTPGKKTPAKTPRSSGKKKAMRRLIMDSDNVTRSQPRENSIKRALFVSPEGRKPFPQPSCSSVPLQAMKSKRALFTSPLTAETKSLDGTQSDQFLKRKRDSLGDVPEMNRSKIAKSLSFGGDNIGTSTTMGISRRASEVFAARNPMVLSDIHKKKLQWAVSEALRTHGYRLTSAGFREKASALVRLTRRLLTLPQHAARFANPTFSTSETMLKLARTYVFAIIQGRSIEDCFEEEKTKLANEANTKISGYISAAAYQQLKSRQASSTSTSRIKENCNEGIKVEQPKSGSKNILQDKLVNIDTNSSNSSSNSGLSMIDKPAMIKSNSMPSFEEAAKMRARRQISFDNIDFPKR